MNLTFASRFLLAALLASTAIAWSAPAMPPLPPGEDPNDFYAPRYPPARDTAPPMEQLSAQHEALEKRLAAGEIPADARNIPLLRLKLEQAYLHLEQLRTGYYGGWTDDVRQQLKQVLDRAEAVSRAAGDAALIPELKPASRLTTSVGPPVRRHERAYIALADGSVQPYWVFVPENYTPQKRYPLVVFLHGYDPYITKIEPWIPSEETARLFTARGYLLAVPYGRRNSDFVNIGEDDTVSVTEEVQRHYSVDANRRFLLGTSMGGYGAYAIGLHRPGLWAGVVALSARSDFYLWFNLDRDKLPAWKRVLFDADDPRRLRRNALHLPLNVQHGRLDSIVKVEHARLFIADLKQLDYTVRYREQPASDHYIYWGNDVYEQALDWMQMVRAAPPARRVAYTTGSLRDNKAYWAEINAFDRYDQLASITALVRPGNVVEVQSENVAAFTLTPPPAWLDTARPITMRVNGVAAVAALQPNGALSWRRPTAAGTSLSTAESTSTSTSISTSAQPEKTPRRSGPIKNCYRDPFLLVYGTRGRTELGNPDQMHAFRFAREWHGYADGVPPLKADTEVTDDDRARYNLILFGTRDSNALLAEIAARLPLELTKNGYRLGDREIVTDEKPGAKLGLQFCYPSPWSDERMVVVQSGLYWGDALPINHKFDLLPEFIVYTDEVVPPSSPHEGEQTNRALAAGFFDHHWQLTTATPDASIPVTREPYTPPASMFNAATGTAPTPYPQAPPAYPYPPLEDTPVSDTPVGDTPISDTRANDTSF